MPIRINAGGVTVDLDLGLHKFTDQLKAARRMYGQAVKDMMAGAARAHAILIKARADAAAVPARTAANAAAQMVRAHANASAQAVRATASALATQRKAQAQAHATMIRAQGTVTAQRIRAVGSIVTGSIRALAAPINAVTRPLAAVVNSVTRLAGGGFGLGGLLGIGGIGAGIGGAASIGKIVRDAADMEKAVARLGRASGLNGRPLEDLGEGLRKFAASTTGISTEKIFDLATFGAKLGIAGPSLELFTHDLAKMGMVLEDIPVQEAATNIARLMAVFRQGPDTALRFASALNALDLASTANADDILNVTRRLAPMFSFLGGKPTQAMALATALREANVPIETAGTSITQVLGKMLDPRRTAGFAKVAGMGAKEFTRTATNDPLKALSAFIKGLSTMDKLQGVRALDKLSLDGQRARGTLLLLVPVLDKLAQFTKIADDEWQNMSSIEKGVASVSATLWAQWEKLRNNFTLTSAELGRGLLPAVKGLGEGLVQLFTDVRDWAEANRKAFEGWGKWLGDNLRMVGVLFREWRTFRDLGFSFLREAWEKVEDVATKLFGEDGAVWGNLRVLGHNTLNLFKNVFDELSGMAGDLFGQLSANFAAQIKNALNAVLPAALGGGGPAVPVPAIIPKGFNAGNLNRNLMPFPGFPGLFQNMPNRQAERAPLMGQIAGAAAAQQQAAFQAGVMQRQADQEQRFRAEVERRGGGPRALAKEAQRRADRNRRARLMEADVDFARHFGIAPGAPPAGRMPAAAAARAAEMERRARERLDDARNAIDMQKDRERAVQQNQDRARQMIEEERKREEARKQAAGVALNFGGRRGIRRNNALINWMVAGIDFTQQGGGRNPFLGGPLPFLNRRPGVDLVPGLRHFPGVDRVFPSGAPGGGRAGELEDRMLKLTASVEALKGTMDKLLQPGKLVGRWA